MVKEKIKYGSKRWFCLDDLLNEEWKDIKGYETLYQISNYGRVKSLTFKNNRHRVVFPRSKIKSFNKTGKRNYFATCLSDNKKKKYFLIHRLVADAFIQDRSKFKKSSYEKDKIINLKKLDINHIDNNSQNNIVDNLEWCTRKYNIDYSQAIKIKQYDRKKTFLKNWESISDAGRTLNIHKGNIIEVCKGQRKTAGGYIWEYKKILEKGKGEL